MVNTVRITSGQTQQTLLHCIVQYVIQLHVSALFRPSSGCIYLALGVLYHDNKVYYFDDEILIILTLALVWRVCRPFQYEWVQPWVWVGSDG